MVVILMHYIRPTTIVFASAIKITPKDSGDKLHFALNVVSGASKTCGVVRGPKIGQLNQGARNPPRKLKKKVHRRFSYCNSAPNCLTPTRAIDKGVRHKQTDGMEP